MSCSKHLPPFTFDVLCYLNRNQLERFSIVCRPLKNFINRYFNSKPYRIFDQLLIRAGSYALYHNGSQWHPNRDEFFGSAMDFTYYSFAEMHPYLGPTVRVELMVIYVAGEYIYDKEQVESDDEQMESMSCYWRNERNDLNNQWHNIPSRHSHQLEYLPEDITELESISYLWRNGDITVWNARDYDSLIVAEYFQPILNSPTILQCRDLSMDGALFSFKDYKVLYTVQVIRMIYHNEDIDLTYFAEFLEQPGVKPVVFVVRIDRAIIANVLDHLCMAFSSAVVPNEFKLVFSIRGEVLTEFQEINKTLAEKLELKEGIPVGYERLDFNYSHYTLERSSI